MTPKMFLVNCDLRNVFRLSYDKLVLSSTCGLLLLYLDGRCVGVELATSPPPVAGLGCMVAWCILGDLDKTRQNFV